METVVIYRYISIYIAKYQTVKKIVNCFYCFLSSLFSLIRFSFHFRVVLVHFFRFGCDFLIKNRPVGKKVHCKIQKNY